MKKTILSFWALLLVIITINFCNTEVKAVESDVDTYYEEVCDEINAQRDSDAELIEKYGQYIDIVDGKYEFNYSYESNEDTQFIQSNIEQINLMVDTGEAYIEDDEVVITCEEQLAIQFGIKKISSHWYGFDFSLDKETMTFIGTLSIVSRLISGKSLKNIYSRMMNNTDNILGKVVLDISSKLSSASSFAGTAGSRLFSAKVIEKYGSINAFVDTIETFVSTAFVAVTSYLAVAFATTGGVGAIVMTVVNYIIGLYMPGMISSVIALVSGLTPWFYSSAKMTVRWFKGWGINRYFNN